MEVGREVHLCILTCLEPYSNSSPGGSRFNFVNQRGYLCLGKYSVWQCFCYFSDSQHYFWFSMCATVTGMQNAHYDTETECCYRRDFIWRSGHRVGMPKNLILLYCSRWHLIVVCTQCSIKSNFHREQSLENPRDGGAWWAAIYGVAQSRTRLKRLSSSREDGGVLCLQKCVSLMMKGNLETSV